MDSKIEEGNRLTAEFMGVKIGVDTYSWRIGCLEPLKIHHLAYHKEWGWIMPVIESIGAVHYGSDWANFYSYSEILQHISQKTKEPILMSTISSVWQATVYYIQWFSAQSKQKQ